MTEINIEELRAIQQAATLGPYKLHPHSELTVVAATTQDSLLHRPVAIYATIESNWADGDEIAERNRANARYGVAFNPELTGALLDRLERYKAALGKIALGDHLSDWARHVAEDALNPKEAQG